MYKLLISKISNFKNCKAISMKIKDTLVGSLSVYANPIMTKLGHSVKC